MAFFLKGLIYHINKGANKVFLFTINGENFMLITGKLSLIRLDNTLHQFIKTFKITKNVETSINLLNVSKKKQAILLSTVQKLFGSLKLLFVSQNIYIPNNFL
jgi:hypothetical protein